MRKIVFAYLLLLLFTNIQPCYCNNTVVPGYIITLQNDTIFGNIDITEFKSRPFEMIFKESGSVDWIVYSPLSIKGFEANSEIYKGAIVALEQSAFKTHELSESPHLNYNVDTVFLQMVISGEKELLYLKDTDGKNFFFINNENGYRWLVHKRFLQTKNEKTEIVSNNNYIGQLIMYLQDCSSINKVLSATTYDIESLIKAFNYYYDCSNTKINYTKKKETSRFEISALAGLTFTKQTFNGVGQEYLTDVSFPWSVNYSLGAAADIKFPRFLGRWSINNEILLVRYLTESNYYEKINNNSFVNTQSQIGSTYIKLNNMFRANFNVNAIKLFLDVGFSNGFSVASTNYKNVITSISAQETSVKSNALEKMRKYEASLLFGFGVKVNKLFGFFRYEIGRGVSGSSDLDSGMSRFYLVAGYRFF